MFLISSNSQKPIYQQLLEQGRQRILSNRIIPGTRLPSIRDVALDLGINHHTVAKAYQQLEEEGLIVMRRGKGAFVVDEIPLEKRQSYINNKVIDLVNEFKELGVKEEELISIIKDAYKRG